MHSKPANSRRDQLKVQVHRDASFHSQTVKMGKSASRIHHSSIVNLVCSRERHLFGIFWRCEQVGVPYTMHPIPGRVSHSMCSRRRFMSNLYREINVTNDHYGAGGINRTYATLPRQNRKSLPKSHPLSLGHSKCNFRRETSQSIFSSMPVSTRL